MSSTIFSHINIFVTKIAIGDMRGRESSETWWWKSSNNRLENISVDKREQNSDPQTPCKVICSHSTQAVCLRPANLAYVTGRQRSASNNTDCQDWLLCVFCGTGTPTPTNINTHLRVWDTHTHTHTHTHFLSLKIQLSLYKVTFLGPQIQPTTDWKYLVKCCVCPEHIPTFASSICCLNNIV
jgi:hypothetical protein